MSAHLLPGNATPLEQAASLAIAPAALEAADEAIRRFKTEPADALLPWLIWEYGLAELLPYLPEPRRAIADGVLWQRLRGTPRALEVALGWIGAGRVSVEQEEPGSVHWAEFQLDPGRWLAWEEIGRIVAVARLSAPARSRLARLYHGHDVRRVKLDASRLDDALLSDYSGTRWADGATRVSFGRLWQEEADAALASARLDAQRIAAHARYGRYSDRCLLSAMRFGCRPIPNPAFEVASAHEKAQLLGVLGLCGVLPERRFAKAQIVLSQAWPLGETNACTPPRVWMAAEEPMRLGDALSAGIGAGRWVAVTERLEAGHGQAITLPAPQLLAARAGVTAEALRADRHRRLSDLRLSDERLERDAVGRAALRHIAASCPPALSAMSPRRRFAKAQIVLSQAWPLGETHARTPRSAWQPTEAATRLGELVLCGPAALVFGPLDALDERVRAAALEVPHALSGMRGHARHHARAAVVHADGSAWASTAARHAKAATYRAQRWAGRWQQTSWPQARQCLQSQHLSTTE